MIEIRYNIWTEGIYVIRKIYNELGRGMKNEENFSSNRWFRNL